MFFYAFVKSLPKLHLYVLLYKWKNIEMEVSAKEPRYSRWYILRRQWRLTMETVISAHIAHNLLHRADISMGQRKLIKKISLERAILCIPVLRVGSITSCCCCSVAKSCLTLCDPMDFSMSGFPVFRHLHLLQFAPIHVHWFSDAIQSPQSAVTLFSICLQSFPASGSLPMSQFFALGGQSIGASASVFPMNIKDWFPLELTGLISLQSKGLSRVLSSTIIRKHQFFSVQPSLWSNSHINTWQLENHSFDYVALYGQSDAFAF